MSTFVKSYNVEVNDVITNTGNKNQDRNSVLLCSRRGNPNAATPLTLNPLTIDLYRPYLVPAQYTVSGSSALAWAKSIGATVKTGISGTFNMVAPTSILVNGAFVILTYASEVYGIQNLLGGFVSGTLTQAVSTATGSIYSVSQVGNTFNITLSNVVGTFNLANVISVVYDNDSAPLPDGLATEQWVLDLYYACEAIQIPNTPNLTFATPTITLSLVSDRDDDFNAVATPVTISAPDTATANPDGSVLLAWDVVPANWLYVPQQAFGVSTLTQATSAATGTISQQLGGAYSDTGNGVSILLTDVTGTFDTTNTLSLVLDDTITTFSLLGTNWYKFVSAGTQAQITVNNDLNITAVEFLDYINSVNTQQATSVDQFGTIGVFAQVDTNFNDFINNAQPNNDNLVCAFYYYPTRISDVYISWSQVSAAFAALSACNTVPYNSMYNVPINGLPVCSDPTTYIDTGVTSSAEALLQFGYTPIAVNKTTGIPYIYMPVTTQTTINGLQDVEFYDIRTQQVRSEIDFRLASAVKTPLFQNTIIDTVTLKNIFSAVYATLKRSERENLIFNVDRWKEKISVKQSNVDPHQVNVSCVIQISPSLTSILIDVNVVSSTISPPTTQA